jgi:hypothetical protein
VSRYFQRRRVHQWRGATPVAHIDFGFGKVRLYERQITVANGLKEQGALLNWLTPKPESNQDREQDSCASHSDTSPPS